MQRETIVQHVMHVMGVQKITFQRLSPTVEVSPKLFSLYEAKGPLFNRIMCKVQAGCVCLQDTCQHIPMSDQYTAQSFL